MNATIRNTLRTEIEITRERFHRFLVTIPDNALKLRSKDPGWTNSELLYLMSVAPQTIKSILNKYMRENPQPRSISNKITGPLLQKTGEMFIRSRGHHSDRWALASQYDSSYTMVLEMLDAISDNDFEKILAIPNMDPLLPEQLTIEDLFHYVKNHFDAYSKQINLGKYLRGKE